MKLVPANQDSLQQLDYALEEKSITITLRITHSSLISHIMQESIGGKTLALGINASIGQKLDLLPH